MDGADKKSYTMRDATLLSTAFDVLEGAAFPFLAWAIAFHTA